VAATPPSPRPLPVVTAAAPPSRTGRLTGEELIDDLFESMHTLDFCKDAIDGAAFTLQLAMEKLGSAAGMVHLYDIDRREFVVVHAAGPGAEALRGLRTADTEPLVDESMRTQGALFFEETSPTRRTKGRRWEVLRAAIEPPRTTGSIACARVAQGGRFLGLIELVHLAGAPAFAEGDDHALSYIAKRFTEFCAERGVLLSGDG
jgi:GAF domain-containing protein